MKCLIPALLLAFPAAAVADSERMPQPLVFVAPSQTTYLRLVPDRPVPGTGGRGQVWRVSEPEDELLYETHGWYSFSVLISSDGRYIVHLGPWPRRGSRPDKTLALAFYADGVLQRRYTVSDLIDDAASLQHSVSHYSWGGYLSWAEDRSHVTVTTVENRTLVFDIATGEMTTPETPNADD